MLRAVLVFSAVLIFSGCGDSVKTVALVECKGKVTYQNNPVSGANVTFAVPGNQISVGTTDSNGEFIITTGGRRGAPIGLAKVGVTKAPEGGGPDKTQMTPEQMMEMATKQSESGVVEPEPTSPIPVRYASPETSKLEAAIGEDPAANVFEFILVD